MLTRLLMPLLGLICVVGGAGTAHAGDFLEPPRPNVLIILADDMGYADLGCFGGDIQTPNLDALAHRGLRYTQFYNTARCWTTRVSLITGYYHDQMGSKRPSWAQTLPQMFKPAGYRSYHAGKWHLGKWFKMPLADAGFDRSYFYNDNDRFFGTANHYLDDKKLPDSRRQPGFYSTTETAGRMIGFLKEHAQEHKDKPFFAYLAFTAPHFPLQAEQKDIDKYKDQYADGWDARRARIFARQKQMGLIDTPLSKLEPEILAPSGNPKQRAQLGPGEVPYALDWDELTNEQKQFQATKMRIHAAMVDRMDQEIGRVVEQLKAMGAYENTLILFLSDNGASAEVMVRGDGHDPKARPGSADSYLCLGPGWSSSSNTPFRRHKIWTHEGGISTPLIAHWPKGIDMKGRLVKQPGHVIDLAPTVLSLAGLTPSQPNNADPAMPGQSLVGYFDPKSEQPADTRILYFNHAGNRALRNINFKIVSSKNEQNKWSLYLLSDDRAEQTDLSKKYPDVVEKMIAHWEKKNAQFKKDAAR